ncbi:PhnE/PtxC family ABC transporter permease [Nesterenkonia lacusekhoensis]|uniref:Phosphonate transport system permease protein n=1 Tax=Nesterenkonia lacusekhoensis TaxID=150832 RepID=A0ABS4T3L9_9MICC|nr:ABC transporter permease subunit [Nesterenkonia lacusekhoensis]MBP2319050.1 phosphonate transport system permease protein [Nesterenkonia lacusekhoensis]
MTKASMTYGQKIAVTLVLAVLVAAGSVLLTAAPAAETSDVFRRAMWGSAACTGLIALALAVYGAAYAATGRRRAKETERLKTGERAFTPDALDQRPVRPSKFWYNLALISIGVLFVSSAAGTGMTLSALIEMPFRMWDYIVQMVGGVAQVPDEEAQGHWADAFDAMLESVAIAWIGTLVGALFSLFCGILAARNMTPLAIYIPMRFILSVIRAVPELVFAVAIFIPLLGVGPANMGGAMAGAFALGISSIGTLSKLISEAIEGVDPGPLEAAMASGATHLQRIRWAVLPQVLPEVLAIWLYRFEVNIRASAILGALGAGGIGRLISPPNGLFGQRPYEWDAIGITLFVIILITMLVDQVSGFVRHRVIHGATVRRKKAAKSAGNDDGGSGDTRAAAVPV